jgi:hypothetical protein
VLVTISCPTMRPPIRQPMFLDPEAPYTYVGAAPFVYHLELHHGPLSKSGDCDSAGQVRSTGLCGLQLSQQGLSSDEQTGSARDHQDKGFRTHTGLRIHHAKPVATRWPKLDKGCEPARLIGLRG